MGLVLRVLAPIELVGRQQRTDGDRQQVPLITAAAIINMLAVGTAFSEQINLLARLNTAGPSLFCADLLTFLLLSHAFTIYFRKFSMNYRIRPLMLSEYLLSGFLCKAISLPENALLLFGLRCTGRSREELVTVLPLQDYNQLLP